MNVKLPDIFELNRENSEAVLCAVNSEILSDTHGEKKIKPSGSVQSHAPARAAVPVAAAAVSR